jgi:hypothetical protein
MLPWCRANAKGEPNFAHTHMVMRTQFVGSCTGWTGVIPDIKAAPLLIDTREGRLLSVVSAESMVFKGELLNRCAATRYSKALVRGEVRNC